MYVIKKRKFKLYVQAGVYGGKEWMNIISDKERAYVFDEEAARRMARGMNQLYGTDMWEAVKL